MVVERRDFNSDAEYQEEIERWRGNGFLRFGSLSSSHPQKDFTVLYNPEEVEDDQDDEDS